MSRTILDIAKELNLSRNTVSRALNNSPGVSYSTRKRILEKARELNYRQVLYQEEADINKDELVGSILFLTRASVDNSDFWISVMRGIETVLHQRHYSLVLGIMTEDDLASVRFPSLLKEKTTLGVIMVEICDLRVCNALLATGKATVTVDLPKEHTELIGQMDIVTMENKMNIRAIVNQLIDGGMSQFAFVGDLRSNNVGRGFQERYEALCESLIARGLELDRFRSMLDESEDQLVNLPNLVKKIQSMKSLPDVFMCGNDWTALRLMAALQACGYVIPRDVSIVGFDNIKESQNCTPRLTTIDTPKEQLGIAAATSVLSRIERPELPFVYSQYSTRLVLRESTRIVTVTEG